MASFHSLTVVSSVRHLPSFDGAGAGETAAFQGLSQEGLKPNILLRPWVQEAQLFSPPLVRLTAPFNSSWALPASTWALDPTLGAQVPH